MYSDSTNAKRMSDLPTGMTQKESPALNQDFPDLGFVRLNAVVCLAFLVYKRLQMKLGSCYRERNMQLSGSILMSLANFYIELEQF